MKEIKDISKGIEKRKNILYGHGKYRKSSRRGKARITPQREIIWDIEPLTEEEYEMLCLEIEYL